MVQTKFDGQGNKGIRNGNRFGGDKAWKQHRYDGEYANVVVRRAADERFALQQMQADAHCVFGSIGSEPLCDFDDTPVLFTSADETEFVTPDGGTQVHLRYNGSGKLTSAHCRSTGCKL